MLRSCPCACHDILVFGCRSKHPCSVEVSVRLLPFVAALMLQAGILADEMGMGKTIQTIALFLASTPAAGSHKPYLVICPTVALFQVGCHYGWAVMACLARA